MLAEHFAPGFGVLGFGGIVAFATGSMMLVDTDDPAYRLPWQLIAGVATSSAVLLLVVLGFALRAQRRPVVSGREQMLGLSGIVSAESAGEVFARINGELWQVRAGVHLERGQGVRVVGIDGLVLMVEPLENGESA